MAGRINLHVLLSQLRWNRVIFLRGFGSTRNLCKSTTGVLIATRPAACAQPFSKMSQIFWSGHYFDPGNHSSKLNSDPIAENKTIQSGASCNQTYLKKS